MNVNETDILKLKKPTQVDNVIIEDLNDNADTIDTAFGDMQKLVDQSGEKLETHVTDYIKHPGYAHTTGTNTYSVKLTPAPTKLVDGMGIVIRIGSTATGKCRLNVNSLGAKDIRTPDGEDVDDLVSGGVYTVRYNGSAFILQGEGGGKRVDTYEVYNWMMTTVPFKNDGYHFYNSKNNTITVNGGFGDPNGKRIYDLKGSIIASIRNTLRNSNWLVTPEYLAMDDNYRNIIYDMRGNMLIDVPRKGPGRLVGVSRSNNTLVSYGTDTSVGRVWLYDLNGNLVTEYDVRAPDGIKLLDYTWDDYNTCFGGEGIDVGVYVGSNKSGVWSNTGKRGTHGITVRITAESNYREAIIQWGRFPQII